MDLIRLDPRRQRLLRITIFGGLGALAAAFLIASIYFERTAPAVHDVSWYDIDYHNHPDVLLLQQYASIDTTQETGSELAGAEFLAQQLEAAGIPARIERLGERGANLWAILEGRDSEALVLHNHIDVYPIKNPEAWTQPPFSAAIEPPWIYGRGVFDMKSVTIAQLRAMTALATSGTRPRKSVIFLATGSEEVGSELGARWILERRPELARRFWAVLTEGGVVEPTTQTEIKYWGIEFAQRRFAEGYACAAEREDLERFREAILEWSRARQRWTLTPEVESFLAAYAASRTRRDFQEIMAETWRALHEPSAFGTLPPYVQSMFRSEVVPFEPEADPDGGFRMRVLFHLLPGDDYEEVRKRLLPPWLLHGVSVVLRPPLGASGGSPLDHPVFRELVSAVREAHPDTLVGPYFVPWAATDSRFFRQAGIPSYGFSPFVIFSSDTFRVDASNERIGLPGYVAGVELYSRVVGRLAG